MMIKISKMQVIQKPFKLSEEQESRNKSFSSLPIPVTDGGTKVLQKIVAVSFVFSKRASIFNINLHQKVSKINLVKQLLKKKIASFYEKVCNFDKSRSFPSYYEYNHKQAPNFCTLKFSMCTKRMRAFVLCRLEFRYQST